jgi:hypothetical protein
MITDALDIAARSFNSCTLFGYTDKASFLSGLARQCDRAAWHRYRDVTAQRSHQHTDAARRINPDR